jgi:hypothetical protein
MKEQQKVLVEPTKWLKTLATTLDIQSAARHSRIRSFNPALGVSNPRWALRT